mmetsp:Transcript_7064/g.15304  ORF Transcript_7064/g.15304 Transcript_7064/m.15304 type:complete len:283 (-) Transcript_7064:99-947(-)|eukprot:CAMPEP_0113315736 /NCGR_PEP_ID=MMETSP0010_2-20120614/11287_1 /TAXON_ID=216773 ORGANISM="Corethron hystrix, Strain 308" /NCGR_SAMPLE_ID=MMETSP0010_2 /ASSEMBLY_ACC=CAM_ASM_000155 /LENGTH=282 /DNA_ID=CAMNT_0000172301 /DNA_START=74 /DNA_END=922 /DNA_ORIENTATION=- /assembly_acc=CAM_ASM_000155
MASKKYEPDPDHFPDEFDQVGMDDPDFDPKPKALDPVYAERIAAYERDCADGAGSATACHHLAEFKGVVLNQWREAARLFEGACNHTRSEYLTPGCVDMGDGTEAYPAACFNMAKLAFSGQKPTIVPQSDAVASKYFERACNPGGHTPSCYHLAMLKLAGNGVARDTPQALKLLEEACEENEAISCYQLSGLLLRKSQPNGEATEKSIDDKLGVSRDPEKAAELLEKGCNMGHAPACFNLSVLYKNGDDGVKADPKKFAIFKSITENLIKQQGGKIEGTQAL